METPDSPMEKGYLQVYTGNGKGKTTAAFGLVLRAALAGKRVFVGQFVKSMRYHETGIESLLPRIHTEQFGRGCFLDRSAEEEDRAAAREGWNRCREALTGDAYDLVILDELNIALHFGLLEVEQVIEGLRGRGAHVRSGRYRAICSPGAHRRGRLGYRDGRSKALLPQRRGEPRGNRAVTLQAGKLFQGNIENKVFEVFRGHVAKINTIFLQTIGI